MYSFLGLHAIELIEKGKIPQLPYDIINDIISGDYYIDVTEETLLSMLVDWANFDFKVRARC